MLEAGDRLGPYLLQARLGEGGMGVVFLAVEEPDGQTVALKVLRKELASDVTFRRRFAHEARAARQVQHPNLVAVLSSGEHDGYPFLALEYVSGGSLVERLAKGVLGLAELLRLADDLAAGLDALHQGGIVHRDVKLANVLLDEFGKAKLTDFGLARGPAFSLLTQRGDVVGTLDYLAPERIRGTPADQASSGAR
jgi:serine/threonine-protein kinase